MKLVQLRYLVAVAENDLNIAKAWVWASWPTWPSTARRMPTSGSAMALTSSRCTPRGWDSVVVLLRGFMYDFLQMLAPHLDARLVQRAEAAHNQDDVDREFAAVRIPFLR